MLALDGIVHDVCGDWVKIVWVVLCGEFDRYIREARVK